MKKVAVLTKRGRKSCFSAFFGVVFFIEVGIEATKTEVTFAWRPEVQLGRLSAESSARGTGACQQHVTAVS